LLLELPLLGYLLSPDRTQGAVDGFRAWMGRSGRTAAVIGVTLVGVWLTARGVITLL
jgi:Sap, sulfolipid-1-addressing protein